MSQSSAVRVVALAVPGRKVACLTNPVPVLPVRNQCGDSCPQLTGEATRAPRGDRPCWFRTGPGTRAPHCSLHLPLASARQGHQGPGMRRLRGPRCGDVSVCPAPHEAPGHGEHPEPARQGPVGVASSPPGFPGLGPRWALPPARSAWHRPWVLFRRRQLSCSGTQARVGVT